MQRWLTAISGVAILGAIEAQAIAQEATANPPGSPVIQHPEAAVLAQYPEIARRSGDLLEVNLENGAPTRFHSLPCETHSDNECRSYELVNYDPRSALAVVLVGYWEWYGVILIDRRTGQQFEVDELPRISPDGQFLAIVKDDMLNAEFTVDVVRHDREGLAYVARNLKDDVCAFKAWRTSATFLIACTGHDDMAVYAEQAVARRADGTWDVQATGETYSAEEIETWTAAAYAE